MWIVEIYTRPQEGHLSGEDCPPPRRSFPLWFADRFLDRHARRGGAGRRLVGGVAGAGGWAGHRRACRGGPAAAAGRPAGPDRGAGAGGGPGRVRAGPGAGPVADRRGVLARGGRDVPDRYRGDDRAGGAVRGRGWGVGLHPVAGVGRGRRPDRRRRVARAAAGPGDGPGPGPGLAGGRGPARRSARGQRGRGRPAPPQRQ